MKSVTFVALTATLITPVALASGCGGAPPPPAAVAGPVHSAPAPSASAAPARSAPAVVAQRPPPPAVATPMQGEPGTAALVEARLVTSSCANLKEASRRQAKARIKRMIAEVDEQYQIWREQQPSCWEQYRWQAEEDRRRGAPTSPSYGYGFGSGGLGLSGIGAGGGGRGDAVAKAAPPRGATSASGTNNQVAGVDEADIVKHDGRYVYFAMNGALRIVTAMDPRVVSVTKLPGKVRQVFVEGDRAVVYVAYGGSGQSPCTYGYDCVFAGDGSSTKILVFDVTDRSAPKRVREIDLSGSLMAARRIGRAVHTVVSDGDSLTPPYSTWPGDLGMCGTREAAVRAKFARLKQENVEKILATTSFPVIREQGQERPLCENLLRTPMGDGAAYTTVVSFDLTDDSTPAATATLQSRPGAVFASSDALYLSVVHRRSGMRRGWYSFYASVDEASDIHKFHIGEQPGETRYVGSGVVPGHVLNQFSMDEYYGYLRIATTLGRVPDPNVQSAVSILAEAENGNLVRVGAVEKIAPGEDIRSVRFDADRGYVVTFKKTDPLFVLDLYHPARPAILGELKIPGFSTYMHRIDPDHLLSIGFDADDQGGFAYFNGVILQLFDVTVPTEPRLLHKEKIGTRGSSSEAATDHLAFNYFAEQGLLAIPMTICEGGGSGRFGGELTFSGLLVYDVSIEGGFRRRGGIDHGTRGVSCSTWWSNANSAVKRSIFLDELVYSIATDRAKVQRMSHFGEDVADIALLP